MGAQEFSSLAVPSPSMSGDAAIEAMAPPKVAKESKITLSERLDNAMFRIVSGVQRLDYLRRSQLPGGDSGVMKAISVRGHHLDETLFALQRRGSELANDGTTPTSASEGARYAAELEAFAEVQADFLR